MATLSPALNDHKAWLGYLQPDGLVVSAQALLDAGVQIDRGTLADLQEGFKKYVTNISTDEDQELNGIGNFPLFAEAFLEWPAKELVGDLRHEAVPDELTVALPEYEETLGANYALRKSKPEKNECPWSLLIQQLPAGRDLDKPHAAHNRGWEASPSKKFERLLRETKVHVGLIGNGAEWRLVYAPAKENAGNITFKAKDMLEVPGRLILGAFHLLLKAQTVFNAPDKQHLHRLLEVSREYQASVSTKLAEQVLAALYALLRGTQTAHDDSKGKLLADELKNNPDRIYEGLLTVLLRLVFLLFAEDRGLMPGGSVYSRNYSVHGLFEKLRADHEKYGDLMDQRYGAWARLLALCRVVYQGCKHGELDMPPRHGHLFDPERFPFLEGRQGGETERPENLPLLSDGILHQVLTNLLVLDGEKISYRTLDVEEIGSVYQTIMGFGVLISPGTAIALKGKRKKGGVPAAPVIVLEDFLKEAPKDRGKWLKENADHALTGEAEKQLKAASTPDQVLAALANRIDLTATPTPVTKGKMALQPTDERRRSGSHYTPRSFTEPIVRKTLAPILKRLGPNPTVEQILALKIADIAVGSGAFLVEVCRQLAEALVRAWRQHGGRPTLPPDETEELLAMRIIAQTCIYGVDRNQMAVDLAKLSLWLVTLAKNHPFTFLDHALRCGDSLVGLTKKQIEEFTWGSGEEGRLLFANEVRKRTAAALKERQALLKLIDEETPHQEKEEALRKSEQQLQRVRDIGNSVIAAFFSSEKPGEREHMRAEHGHRCVEWLRTGDGPLKDAKEIKELRDAKFPVIPFHWEIEFPEIFENERPGFDGIVGNPPFLGGSKLSSTTGKGYMRWLSSAYSESHGKSDLVAYFFRRAFQITRRNGTLGLIATNTIRQGDTRSTGLRWIRKNGGWIYNADLRRRWPGIAAVIISVVHIIKGGRTDTPPMLNGKPVKEITAYLFHFGPDDDPARLEENKELVHSGTNINGKGFILSPEEKAGFIQEDPRTSQHIRVYLGAEEMNESPLGQHRRYAIHLEGLTESEAQKRPSLYRHLYETVRKTRQGSSEKRLREDWWLYSRPAKGLYEACVGRQRVLASGRAGTHISFIFQPVETVFSDSLTLFMFERGAGFCVMQTRAHEIWARFFSSSLKDDNRYIPEDCFETFPLPKGYKGDARMEMEGNAYYDHRKNLMQDLWLGLTGVYNLFHSQDSDTLEELLQLYAKRRSCPDWGAKEGVPAGVRPMTLYPTPEKALQGIKELRELHAKMDDGVLRAYGWDDLAEKAESRFILDFEDEEVEEESGRERKKPYRYRWPDEFRDEVLARLLKLNAERAKEEELLGQSSSKPTKGAKKQTGGDDNLQLGL